MLSATECVRGGMGRAQEAAQALSNHPQEGSGLTTVCWFLLLSSAAVIPVQHWISRSRPHYQGGAVSMLHQYNCRVQEGAGPISGPAMSAATNNIHGKLLRWRLHLTSYGCIFQQAISVCEVEGMPPLLRPGTPQPARTAFLPPAIINNPLSASPSRLKWVNYI